MLEVERDSKGLNLVFEHLDINLHDFIRQNDRGLRLIKVGYVYACYIVVFYVVDIASLNFSICSCRFLLLLLNIISYFPFH